MTIGNRFPGWTSDRDLQVQLVGPQSGRCRSILDGTMKYLRKNRHTDVSTVGLSKNSDVGEEIKDTDGSVFVFLHPMHASASIGSARKLNKSVMRGVKYWVLSNPYASKNTFLIYEGIGDSMSKNLNNEPTYIKKRFEDAVIREKHINKNEIENMRERILSQCKQFEL